MDAVTSGEVVGGVHAYYQFLTLYPTNNYYICFKHKHAEWLISDKILQLIIDVNDNTNKSLVNNTSVQKNR